jgi:hypothetical protein
MKHSLLQTILKALILHSLDTLSDITIKVFILLFLNSDALSIPNPSLLCLVPLLSVVNNFQLIMSFIFNYIVVIIVCTASESSGVNLI